MRWVGRTSSLMPLIRVKIAPLAAVGVAGMAAATLSVAQPAAAAVAGLARYPYLTDVTTSSVQVTWADTYYNTKGKVTWGLKGTSCNAASATGTSAGTKFTVSSTSEYQHSITLSALSPNTEYCYRIFGGTSTNTTDLLNPDPFPTFKTLPSSGPYTFLVFGDWGDNSTSTTADNQAKLDAVMARTTDATFAVGTGDIAYTTGTPTQYGDLTQTGTGVSQVFGPNYWKAPGSRLPFFSTSGNHGRTSTYFQTWPESKTVTASSGKYGLVNFSSVDGNVASTGPGVWYAFDVAGVRNYVLTADWSDNNTGTAAGAACGLQFAGRTCPDYEVEADTEWAQGSAQYQWLAADLAANANKLKMAFFHYPLRSDDSNEPSDPYLQNSTANPHQSTSLEKLLFDKGVKLAFNGHAHIYQRNVAPPKAVVSYTTGGGGAKLVPIAKGSRVNCATTDAYGLGWGTSASSCGAAPLATSITAASQVNHFLKVTVDGPSVTVTPTTADGNTFDVKTYNFGNDTTAPTAPSSVTAQYVSATQTKAGYGSVGWNAGGDGGSGVAAYDVYRQDSSTGSRAYLATVTPDKTSYTDASAASGTAYVYSVDTRDQAGNTATGTAPAIGGGATPPAAPTNLMAGTPTPSTVPLSWTASGGATTYNIYRGATKVGTSSAASYTDTGLTVSTSYSYTVTAENSAGASSPSNTATATTAMASASAPTAPSLTAGTPTSSSVPLSWTANPPSENVTSYNVYRDDGSKVTTASTAYTDVGRSPNTPYTYFVRAVSAAGESLDSNHVSVTTTSSGTTSALTLDAYADAYVRSDQATVNFGAATQLLVNAATASTMVSYITFNVPALSGTVTSAKLQFYSTSTGSTVTKVSQVTSDPAWSESAITYNTKPSYGGVLGSTSALSANSYAVAPLSGAIIQPGLVSFALTTTATATRYAESKEAAHMVPQLIITTG